MTEWGVTHCKRRQLISVGHSSIRPQNGDEQSGGVCCGRSYRGQPTQTCRRTPTPWCTGWSQRGHCSARSHGAETTWGRPRTAGRTHTTSTGSAGGRKERLDSRLRWTSMRTKIFALVDTLCFPSLLRQRLLRKTNKIWLYFLWGSVHCIK